MKRFAGRFVWTIVVVCLFVGSGSAQEEVEVKNSLQKGKWAMQFELEGSLLNFRLSDFLGTTFSGKYQLSENRALRLGASFGGRSTDYETDNQHVYSQGASHLLQATGTNFNHSIGITMHHLWYLRESNGIFLIAGLGPFLGYLNDGYESTEHIINLATNSLEMS